MAEAIGERDSLELLPITVWSHWVRSSRHSVLPESQSSINFNMAERWAAVGSETAVCWKQPLLTPPHLRPTVCQPGSQLPQERQDALGEIACSRIGATAVAPGEKAIRFPAAAHARLGDTLC